MDNVFLVEYFGEEAVANSYHRSSLGARARIVAFAAAMVTTLLGTQRAAADISYTNFTVFGDQINITSPHATGAFAGQITLTGVTGAVPATNTLLAWCLDVFVGLQQSGTFTLGPPLANVSNLIGGLMLEGNNDITQAQSGGGLLELGGITYTAKDIAAATQIDIWAGIYGAAFTYSSIDSTASAADFGALLTFLEQNAVPNVQYVTLNQSGNQTLGTVPVPGPIVGAGLPGLIAACGGLIALARRRRKNAT